MSICYEKIFNVSWRAANAKEVINASLLKINRLAGTYADANLGTRRFWSSSQLSDYSYSAWYAQFDIGYLYNSAKRADINVCCIIAAF